MFLEEFWPQQELYKIPSHSLHKPISFYENWGNMGLLMLCVFDGLDIDTPESWAIFCHNSCLVDHENGY